MDNMEIEYRDILNTILLDMKDLTKDGIGEAKDGIGEAKEKIKIINSYIKEIEKNLKHFSNNNYIEEVDIRKFLKNIKDEYYHKLNEKKLFIIICVEDNVPEIIKIKKEMFEWTIKYIFEKAEKSMVAGGIAIDCIYKNNQLIIDIVDTGNSEITEEKKDLNLLLFDLYMKKNKIIYTLSSKAGIGTNYRLIISDDSKYNIENNDIENELLTEAKNILPLFLAKIKKSVACEDYENITKNIHLMKGHSSSFCFCSIYNIISEIENIISGEYKISDIYQNIKEIECEIKEIDYENLKIDFNEKKKFKVLIVEDNENILFLIIEFLKQKRIQVSGTKNGKEALIELKKGHYNVVIMDIEMPVLGGDELIKIIREDSSLKKIYAVAVTAKETEEEVQNLFRIGFDDVISKPISKAFLYRVINI